MTWVPKVEEKGRMVKDLLKEEAAGSQSMREKWLWRQREGT